MPIKPPTACRRCGKGCSGGYCAECKAINSADAKQQGLKRREVDGQREWKKLYDRSRWRHPQYGLQAACLRRDPVCRKCHRAASTVADHVVDHRGDEKLFWDFGNLQGLCKPCHDAKPSTKECAQERPGLVDNKVVDYMTPEKIR